MVNLSKFAVLTYLRHKLSQGSPKQLRQHMHRVLRSCPRIPIQWRLPHCVFLRMRSFLLFALYIFHGIACFRFLLAL